MARRVASADPAGLLYGAIVSAATLAAVSLHEDDPTRVWAATGVVLVIYWMADLYVHALTTPFDGRTRGLLHRLALSAAHKSSVLKGGLPAIVVFVVVHLAGADPSGAAFAALGFSVVILVLAGYLGARQAGSPQRGAVVEAVGAGFLGLVIVGAKALLH